MNIQLNQTSKTEALIKINLKPSDYQQNVEKKLKELTKKTQINGFRKGKVPKALMRKMHGKTILIDEVKQMVSHQMQDYIKDNKIKLLGSPLLVQDKIVGLDWENGSDFNFEYEIGVCPEFEVELDKNLIIHTFSIQVDDALLNETVKDIQMQMSEEIEPTVSESGDSLFGQGILPLEKDPRYWSLHLNMIAKEHLNQFIGVKNGDIIEFDLKETIKEESDIQTLLDGDDIFLTEKVKFEVESISRKIPAEINQDLFDEVLGKDAVASKGAFLEKVKTSIEEQHAKKTNRYTKEQIQEALMANTEIELPDKFLQRWLEESSTGEFTKEQLEFDYPKYAYDLKWSLIISQILIATDIKIAHEEVVDKAKKLITNLVNPKGKEWSGMGRSETFPDYIDSLVDTYLKDEEGRNYENLSKKISEDKAMDYITTQITIKAKDVSLEEYTLLQKEDDYE